LLETVINLIRFLMLVKNFKWATAGAEIAPERTLNRAPRTGNVTQIGAQIISAEHGKQSIMVIDVYTTTNVSLRIANTFAAKVMETITIIVEDIMVPGARMARHATMMMIASQVGAKMTFALHGKVCQMVQAVGTMMNVIRIGVRMISAVLGKVYQLVQGATMATSVIQTGVSWVVVPSGEVRIYKDENEFSRRKSFLIWFKIRKCPSYQKIHPLSTQVLVFMNFQSFYFRV